MYLQAFFFAASSFARRTPGAGLLSAQSPKQRAVDTFSGVGFAPRVAQNQVQPLVSRKQDEANSRKTDSEPGRAQSCNPLSNPEVLCGGSLGHFLASFVAKYHGVQHDFVAIGIAAYRCAGGMCFARQRESFHPHSLWFVARSTTPCIILPPSGSSMVISNVWACAPTAPTVTKNRQRSKEMGVLSRGFSTRGTLAMRAKKIA